MRIAQVTATFPPYYAGTGMVCYYNARELARLGHQVHIYTAAYPGAPSREERDGLTIHRLSPLIRLGNAPFLPGLLRLKGFDILHLHHPFIFGTEMVWLVSKLRKIPYVLTHHNDLLGDGLRRKVFDLYSTLIMPLIFREAKKFAVVSLDHAANCRATPWFRQRWQEVVEIPNGVDTNLFHPAVDGKNIRRRLDIADEAKIILFVGALDRAHPFKGVDYLLSVFSSIQDPQAILMIVGDGDLRAEYTSLAVKLNVEKRTIFVGAVPNQLLPPYYAAADLLVLSSFPPESFGLVLIEAMSCGLPVLAHDIPGVRSIVSDGIDGFLAQPGIADDLAEKIVTLLDNPRLRREMGKCGRTKAIEHYDWVKVSSKLVQAYEAILKIDEHQSWNVVEKY
jgi:glycosyltransferase involved in cell wall biosynthesis